jgi:hypothetical protein
MSRTQKKALAIGAAVIALAAACALFLPQALAGKRATYSDRVYELSYQAKGDAPMTVYVSLATGAWRQEMGEETRISGAGSYEIINRDLGNVYRRVGTPKFMGFLQAAPTAAAALRAYEASGQRSSFPLAERGRALRMQAQGNELRATTPSGQTAFTMAIVRKVSDQDAREMQLFAQVRPTVADVELAVGQAPSLPVRGYWFGPTVSGKVAAAAAQHMRRRTATEIAGGMNARGESTTQITLYELPGTTATSAEPGIAAQPAGEWQVSSEPLDSAHAQLLVRAMNGHNGDASYPAWPRTTIELANGERATVVADHFDADGGSGLTSGFSVLTATTFVHVNGSVPTDAVAGLAAQLRPLR